MVWGEIHKESFLGKPEREREIGRLRHRWESYITSLKEVGYSCDTEGNIMI